MKKGCLYSFLLFAGIATAIFTINPLAIAVGNIISLSHRNGYFIPNESSVYKFQETKSNKGSGEYWMYGEDETYYYYNGECGENSYSFFKNEDAKTTINFNRHNYNTWQYCSLPTQQKATQEEALVCGDLLANFGFENCEYPVW